MDLNKTNGNALGGEIITSSGRNLLLNIMLRFSAASFETYTAAGCRSTIRTV